MAAHEDRVREFKQAVCERLGLDELTTTDVRVEITGRDPQARVTWTGARYVPLDQLADLFAVED